MEVNFLRAVESPVPDILVQEMVECQNELNAEYYNKLSGITAEFTSSLQDYLDRNHPGLDVPHGHDPYLQFVKNSFDDMVYLKLEVEDLILKFVKCSELQHAVFTKTIGLPNTYSEENEDILKYICKSVDIVAQMRVDMERKVWRLTLSYQKLKDLVRTTATATASSGDNPDDAFLGILRKGILSSMNHDSYASILTSFRETWPKISENIKFWLSLIDDHLKLLGVHKPGVVAVVGEGQEETLHPEQDLPETQRQPDPDLECDSAAQPSEYSLESNAFK